MPPGRLFASLKGHVVHPLSGPYLSCCLVSSSVVQAAGKAEALPGPHGEATQRFVRILQGT
jgi:hypothetical protein